MYDRFKMQFLEELQDSFSPEEIKTISSKLDFVSVNYKIEKMCTDIVVYEGGFPQEAKDYLISKKIKGLADGTLKNYMLLLNNFFNTVRKPLDKIETRDIVAFMYIYRTYHHISDRSADKYRQYLLGFFTWLNDNKYITDNPMRNFDNIKYERKQRTYVNHMELELIRNACRTPRETFIVEFLFSTGCRVHEFVNVRLDDIDLVNQTVHLFGKGKKHRTSFLNAKAIVAYKKYMDTRIDHTNYLIVDVKNKENPNCASTKSIRECLHNIISRTDIEKNVTPHVMRHTTASLALQAGMDMDIVSKLLGHASISTTQIYAERDESDMQTAHKKYLS